MAAQPAQHALATDEQLTRDEYYRRYQESGAHVELIEGRVYQMSPAGARHASLVYQLRRLLEGPLDPDTHLVFQERTLVLPGASDPEPDLAIVQGSDGGYATRHPGPGDVVLLVEVADSSLDYDRTVKVPLYAAHQIPELWIVEAPARIVRVYRDPDPQQRTYRSSVAYRDNDSIAPPQLPGIVISVGEIFR